MKAATKDGKIEAALPADSDNREIAALVKKVESLSTALAEERSDRVDLEVSQKFFWELIFTVITSVAPFMSTSAHTSGTWSIVFPICRQVWCLLRSIRTLY